MNIEFKEEVRQTPHSASNPIRDLIRGRLLARNTFFNLVGQGAPVVVALFAIPLLIKGLGIDRFGILALVWMVIGYFNLFDLGLGRALTQLVAERLGAGQEEETASLVWTALLIMLLLGVAGGVVVSLLAPCLVEDIFKIPQILQRETLNAFYLLAFSIPIVISTAAMRGILAAQQRFDLINVIRIFMGVVMFLGPLLVLFFSQNLFLVVAVLVTGRLVAWLLYLFLCLRVMPTLRRRIRLQRAVVAPLIRFGSWMTVTNIIGPLMVYLDRFLIGAFVSVTAVAYYATPYEVVTKLLLIASAVTGVLFPAFAASFAQNPNATAMVFNRAVKYVFLALYPIILLIVTFAQEGLHLWLGAEFSKNSASILKWLAAGVLINSLAQIPFGLIQGAGRPDLTAKLHLLELPFYLLALWWLLSAYGVEGAAVAWVARAALDASLLFALAKRLLKDRQGVVRPLAFAAGAALVTLVFAITPLSLGMKGFFLLLALVAFAVVAWCIVLVQQERELPLNFLKASYVRGRSFMNNIHR